MTIYELVYGLGLIRHMRSKFLGCTFNGKHNIRVPNLEIEEHFKNRICDLYEWYYCLALIVCIEGWHPVCHCYQNSNQLGWLLHTQFKLKNHPNCFLKKLICPNHSMFCYCLITQICMLPCPKGSCHPKTKTFCVTSCVSMILILTYHPII